MAQANAGAITKLLKANGFTRTEWRKIGVTTYNEGFNTEQGLWSWSQVILTWEFAGWFREATADELAIIHARFAEMCEVLVSKGYEVISKGGYTTPYLIVNKPE
jgi:hypothetical protein